MMSLTSLAPRPEGRSWITTLNLDCISTLIHFPRLPRIRCLLSGGLPPRQMTHFQLCPRAAIVHILFFSLALRIACPVLLRAREQTLSFVKRTALPVLLRAQGQTTALSVLSHIAPVATPTLSCGVCVCVCVCIEFKLLGSPTVLLL